MSDEHIKHVPCPLVGCDSSDAFNYDFVNQRGSCFSCGGKYPAAEKKLKPWAKEKYPFVSYKERNGMSDPFEFTGKNIQPKDGTPSLEGEYIEYRGITPRTMEYFSTLTYGHEQEYVYPSGGIKVRNIDVKGFHAKGGLRSDELWGMNLFPAGCSKFVTITEGELDAMSAHQMLSDGRRLTPVVSLPSATPSKKLWENCHDWLNSFEKIILSIENDEPGREVADKIAKMFPNKVFHVDHGSLKDANEFLQEGKREDFKSAWWGARKYVPENILNTTEQFLDLYQNTPEYQFIPTGIQGLDNKILGLMQGHFTVFKAPTGIGKTELMRHLEYSMLKQGIPIAVWHLEEPKLRGLLGLVSYEAGDNLTRRDLIEDKGAEDTVVESIKALTEDELLYQFYLSDGQGGDDLIEQIRFFSQACGCKFVFFEPIQDVVVGSSEESKEAMLADLSIRLSKLAVELNVGIVTIAHTNEFGDPKYCKMIGQRASVVINLDRDKGADNYDERNTTYLTVEKNRPCSEEGRAGMMKFSTDTFTMEEVL